MKNKGLVKRLFINPFEYFSEKPLFVTGSIFYVMASLLVVQQGQQFNGFMHLYPSPASSFFSVLSKHLSFIAISVLLLFGIGKAINIKTRLIDVLNVVLIARIPFYLLLFLSFAIDMDANLEAIKAAISEGDYNLESISKWSLMLLGLFGIGSILIIVYHYYLIVKGMQIATNNKKRWVDVVILALYFITDLVIQFLAI